VGNSKQQKKKKKKKKKKIATQEKDFFGQSSAGVLCERRAETEDS
jgi:hypothetical protein